MSVSSISEIVFTGHNLGKTTLACVTSIPVLEYFDVQAGDSNDIHVSGVPVDSTCRFCIVTIKVFRKYYVHS